MCKLHYCNKSIITLDGYCFKHKHYSMENRFVIEHIEKYNLLQKNDFYESKGIKIL